MKSLNLKSFVAVLFIAAATLVSCKKDTVEPPPAPEAGTWVGKYGMGQNQPNFYLSFIINSDGTLQARVGNDNNPTSGTGTWTSQGGVFKAVYYYNNEPDKKYNVYAAIDVENNNMAGEWGEGEQQSFNGHFYMHR